MFFISPRKVPKVVESKVHVSHRDLHIFPDDRNPVKTRAGLGYLYLVGFSIVSNVGELMRKKMLWRLRTHVPRSIEQNYNYVNIQLLNFLYLQHLPHLKRRARCVTVLPT